MKKLVALLLALMLLCSCALAEIYTIPGAPFTVDVPDDITPFPLTDEDYEEDEGIVMAFGDEDSPVGLNIYVYEDETMTLDEIKAYYEEEAQANPEYGTIVNSGFTTVNGINMLYILWNVGTENQLDYYFYDNDMLYDFFFWFSTEAEGQMTAAMMNSLTRK